MSAYPHFDALPAARRWRSIARSDAHAGPDVCRGANQNSGGADGGPQRQVTAKNRYARALAVLRHKKVEEIAEAVAKLPPDQLAREAVAATAIGEEAVVADSACASVWTARCSRVGWCNTSAAA